MSGLKMIEEIDSTLDQLILNAEVISNADLNDLSQMELKAFKKTQESLLNHLLIMDSLQDKRSASLKLHEKRMRFEKLKNRYSKELNEILDCKPIVCKRRNKKFFDLRGRRSKVLVRR